MDQTMYVLGPNNAIGGKIIWRRPLEGGYDTWPPEANKTPGGADPVHHDFWDYDLATVAQVTKFRFVYVFDRLTGSPLWRAQRRTISFAGNAQYHRQQHCESCHGDKFTPLDEIRTNVRNGREPMLRFDELTLPDSDISPVLA